MYVTIKSILEVVNGKIEVRDYFYSETKHKRMLKRSSGDHLRD